MRVVTGEVDPWGKCATNAMPNSIRDQYNADGMYENKWLTVYLGSCVSNKRPTPEQTMTAAVLAAGTVWYRGGRHRSEFRHIWRRESSVLIRVIRVFAGGCYWRREHSLAVHRSCS